jgi:UDP-glucose 4-epimerase
MPNFKNFAVCGAGFIGKNLTHWLIAQGYRVNVLDRNSCPKEFLGKTHWVTGEFANNDNLRKTLAGVEVAFHLVSSSVPGDDAIELVKGLSDNIISTLAFLDMCKECDVKRVIFVSSSSVYGLQTKTPIAESATTDPISAHGIEKLTIEKYLLLYKFLHGIDVKIVRVSNPYGAGQDLLGRQGFVAIAVGRLLKHEPILLRGSGRPIRDFIYIDDVSNALTLAGTLEYEPSTLNIGSNKGHSLSQVVTLLRDITEQTLETVLVESQKIDIPESILNISLAQDYIFFKPHFSMRAGLVKTLQYYEILTPGEQ